MKFNLRVVLTLTVFLLLGSCARNPVTGKKEIMLMSESQEIAMGQQYDPSIVAAYGVYDDAAIQAFINTKGQEMAKISHRPNLNFEFKVLDSPVVNAFALPGGYVYFTRGILAHFNNEAEFAGVLGHEIGHVTARHSAKQYSKQILAQVGLMAGVIASEDFRQFANVAAQGMGLLFLKFGRDHESESDRLGVEYSTKIGYNSHEMADFFQTLNRLQEQAGASIPTFLSTHPNPVDRYNTVHQLSDEVQKNMDVTQLKVNRDNYLNLIDGIIYGDDPRQGYVLANVFYHPVLKFQFNKPADWQLVNMPTQVQIAPQDGKALILLTLSQQKTLEAASQDAVTKYKLSIVESTRRSINGNPAIIMISDQVPDTANGQQAQTIRIMSYFISYGEYIYEFHGMSLKSDFNKYSPTLKSSIQSFKALTDPARINVQPARVAIKTVSQNGTLSQVLAQMGIPGDQMEEVAILNSMLVTDNVQAGTRIKTIAK